MARRITWDDDIKDFFTQMDVGCMRARGLDLSDYASVKSRDFSTGNSGRWLQSSNEPWYRCASYTR